MSKVTIDGRWTGNGRGEYIFRHRAERFRRMVRVNASKPSKKAVDVEWKKYDPARR